MCYHACQHEASAAGPQHGPEFGWRIRVINACTHLWTQAAGNVRSPGQTAVPPARESPQQRQPPPAPVPKASSPSALPVDALLLPFKRRKASPGAGPYPGRGHSGQGREDVDGPSKAQPALGPDSGKLNGCSGGDPRDAFGQMGHDSNMGEAPLDVPKLSPLARLNRIPRKSASPKSPKGAPGSGPVDAEQQSPKRSPMQRGASAGASEKLQVPPSPQFPAVLPRDLEAASPRPGLHTAPNRVPSSPADMWRKSLSGLKGRISSLWEALLPLSPRATSQRGVAEPAAIRSTADHLAGLPPAQSGTLTREHSTLTRDDGTLTREDGTHEGGPSPEGAKRLGRPFSGSPSGREARGGKRTASLHTLMRQDALPDQPSLPKRSPAPAAASSWTSPGGPLSQCADTASVSRHSRALGQEDHDSRIATVHLVPSQPRLLVVAASPAAIKAEGPWGTNAPQRGGNGSSAREGGTETQIESSVERRDNEGTSSGGLGWANASEVEPDASGLRRGRTPPASGHPPLSVDSMPDLRLRGSPLEDATEVRQYTDLLAEVRHEPEQVQMEEDEEEAWHDMEDLPVDKEGPQEDVDAAPPDLMEAEEDGGQDPAPLVVKETREARGDVNLAPMDVEGTNEANDAVSSYLMEAEEEIGPASLDVGGALEANDPTPLDVGGAQEANDHASSDMMETEEGIDPAPSGVEDAQRDADPVHKLEVVDNPLQVEAALRHGSVLPEQSVSGVPEVVQQSAPLSLADICPPLGQTGSPLQDSRQLTPEPTRAKPHAASAPVPGPTSEVANRIQDIHPRGDLTVLSAHGTPSAETASPPLEPNGTGDALRPQVGPTLAAQEIAPPGHRSAEPEAPPLILGPADCPVEDGSQLESWELPSAAVSTGALLGSPHKEDSVRSPGTASPAVDTVLAPEGGRHPPAPPGSAEQVMSELAGRHGPLPLQDT